MKEMLISIVTPTKNEFQNIEKLSLEIQKIFESLGINYEHIIIDNDSSDGTVELIKKLAKQNSKIKVILNASDYGQIRSPFYGMLQTSGDAVIFITSDFQTPIEIIPELTLNPILFFFQLYLTCHQCLAILLTRSQIQLLCQLL